MILFYLLIAVMPLERHPIWNRAFADVTLTKYVGVVCVLVAFFHLAQRRSAPPFLATLQARLYLLFLTFAIVIYPINGAAFDPQNTSLVSYFSFFVLMLITMILVDTPRRLYWSLVVGVASVAWTSLYSIREWVAGVRQWGPAFRPGWVAGDSNYFGVNVLLCLPVALVFLLNAKKGWQRYFFLGCILLALAATMVGASRGGLLGFVAEFLYLLAHAKRRKVYLAVLSAVVIPFLVLSPASPVKRLLSPTHSDERSSMLRITGWKVGLNMIESHPLIGIGLGRYKQVGAQYDPSGEFAREPHIAHNAYLEIAAEMGIPMLVLFLMIILATFRTLRTVRKRASAVGAESLALWSLGVQSGLVGALVAVFFVSGQYQKMFWLFISLSMCMPSLVPKRAVGSKQFTAPKHESVREPVFQVGPALVELR